MKGLLEYLKIENISHPAPSDVEIGMLIGEKKSSYISKFISDVFENETVTFNCKSNGIESYVVIISETKKMQFTFEDSNSKFSYIITDTNDVLLESMKDDSCSKANILKERLKEYGNKKRWVKQ